MDPKKSRLSKRRPFRKRVKFGPQNPDYIGHTVNFSKMGIQIESTKLYSPGTPLVIEIVDNLNFASSNGAITFLGKVVWALRGIEKRGNMGIEFLTQCKDIENEYERTSS
ncbi:MAG: PilZ domain-containing protein [Thermodesulfobacteriota bacterium]